MVDRFFTQFWVITRLYFNLDNCLLKHLFLKDKIDFYEQILIMLRYLLNRLNNESPKVLKSAHITLGAMSKYNPAEELVKHMESIRNLIALIVSDARR